MNFMVVFAGCEPWCWLCLVLVYISDFSYFDFTVLVRRGRISSVQLCLFLPVFYLWLPSGVQRDMVPALRCFFLPIFKSSAVFRCMKDHGVSPSTEGPILWKCNRHHFGVSLPIDVPHLRCHMDFLLSDAGVSGKASPRHQLTFRTF